VEDAHPARVLPRRRPRANLSVAPPAGGVVSATHPAPVYVCVCERENVCVCERERMCVCVCVREREYVSVCVCV